MRHRLPTLTLAAVVAATIPAHAQPPVPSQEADSLMHVMLTLEAQAISFAYEPALADNAGVLAGTNGARARIGTLESHRALRLGTLEPDVTPPAPREEGEPAPEPPTHEVWLVRNASGWELEAHHSQTDDVNIIPLSHRDGGESDRPFSASLHATAAEDGRLELRWGEHTWHADFRFEELPPPPRRQRVSGRNAAPRTAESDTTGISRRVSIGERNETALVFPDGRQVTMLYWKGIDVEDEDYGRLGDVADGAVVPLVRAPPLRIKTDVDLRFGSTDVRTGNLAPGYAGAHALWLRRSGDGWQWVFNDEADSWGTQHNPDFDTVAFDVDYTRSDGSFRPLGITLVPTSSTTGRVVVHWGPHEWSAPFRIN